MVTAYLRTDKIRPDPALWGWTAESPKASSPTGMGQGPSPSLSVSSQQLSWGLASGTTENCHSRPGPERGQGVGHKAGLAFRSQTRHSLPSPPPTRGAPAKVVWRGRQPASNVSRGGPKSQGTWQEKCQIHPRINPGWPSAWQQGTEACRSGEGRGLSRYMLAALL